jgi:hypothetical protein
VECAAALAWLKRFPGLRTAAIKVSVGPDGLTATRESADVGTVTHTCPADVKLPASEVAVGVNAYYLRDAIEACRSTGCEVVTISWRDADSQMMVDSGDVRSVVMPMRF